MSNKKILTFLILSLLAINFLFLNVVRAQETPPGLPSELGQEPEDTLQQLKDKTETKWDYLGKEWQNIFLKNPYVSAVDAFLTKISFVFTILFGQPYSLSITLFMIIILWLYFFFKFGEILRLASPFSSGTSWLISFGLVIIMAQFQILRKITGLLGWLVFARKGTWWNILMIGIIILTFFFLYVFSRLILIRVEMKKKEEEKIQRKQDTRLIHATAEGLRKGFSSSSWKNLIKITVIILAILIIIGLIIKFFF